MQKVLITGANGFVGNYLSSAFAGDYEVIATGKGDSRLFSSHPQLRYEKMDFTLENEIQRVFLEVKPDIVIHSGALSKPDECETDNEAAWLTNVTSTKLLLNAAGASNAHFIFLSTDFIFNGEKGFYREDDDPDPVNYYGETKLEAEKLVRPYPAPWAIVRTILVYGDPKSGRQNILTMVSSALKKGEEVKIFSDQLRTPTYVEDLVKGIKLIADKKKTGVYHISGKDALSPYKMAIAVARHLSLDESKVLEVTAKDLSQIAKRPLKTGFDITKARTELGYEPISFAEGLQKTFSDT